LYSNKQQEEFSGLIHSIHKPNLIIFKTRFLKDQEFALDKDYILCPFYCNFSQRTIKNE